MSRKPATVPAGPKAAAPGRPKDLGKGSAILDAAKRLFTAHGFEGASMDQIAAEAGVSKLTVYSHYGDKETCSPRRSNPIASSSCRTCCSRSAWTWRCASACCRSRARSSR